MATGIFFVDENVEDPHEAGRTPRTPLARVAYEKLCPGAAELARLQDEMLRHRQRVAPLPLEDARRLHDGLAR